MSDENGTDSAWWDADDEDAPALVWQLLRSLSIWRQRYIQRRAKLDFTAQRETWLDSTGALSATTDSPGVSDSWLLDYGYDIEGSVSASMNVFAETLKILAGHLFDELPAIEIAPLNGTYEAEQAAKRCSDALLWTLTQPLNLARIRHEGERGLTEGWSAIRPVIQGSTVAYKGYRYDRVFWDPAEAEDGDLQTLHVVSKVSKSRLCARVRAMRDLDDKADDKLCDDIEDMPAGNIYGPMGEGVYTPRAYQRHMAESQLQDAPDMVWVVESWHLPGGRDSGDGVYLMSAHGGEAEADGGKTRGPLVITREEWTHDTFPLCWFSPMPHSDGIDGEGPGDLLLPYQGQIDTAWSRLDESIREYAKTLIVCDGTITDQKQNVAGPNLSFITTPKGARLAGGKGFVVEGANPASLQLIEHIMRLRETMRETVGVNPAMGSGKSQLGANASGIALMEEEGRQNQRLVHMEWQVTQWLLRIALETINAMGRAAKSDKTFQLSFSARDSRMYTRTWAKLEKYLDTFTLAPEPVGPLGKRKSGRMQKLVELAQHIPGMQDLAAEYLMKSPDVQRVAAIQNSGPNLVSWQISVLGDPTASEDDYARAYPTDETPFDLAISRGTAELRDAVRKGAEQATIERLENYINAAKDAILAREEASAPTSPPPPPMPGMGAAPMASRTSPDGMPLDAGGMAASGPPVV
jgi:hypothetical protein